MKKILLLFMGVLVLTGCNSANDETEEISVEEEEGIGYTFTINETEIMVGDDFSNVSDVLGSDYEYQEVESCAFGDLDKIYTYADYEIYNYTDGDDEIIYTITLLTENVETDENIKIGSTTSDVIDAYGDDYQDEAGAYIYTSGDTILTFIFDNDSVISIEYKLNIEE